MTRTGKFLSALLITSVAACAPQGNEGYVDSGETDDRLFDFQFNINVTDIRPMDELTDDASVVISEAREGDEFWENTGASEEEDRKYTVTGPAFEIVMPASGKTEIEVSEEWGSGFGFDDVQFVMLLETPDGYFPRRLYFSTDNLRSSAKYPTNEGEHMAFSFETLEYDKEADSITVRTEVDMTTETTSYYAGTTRTTRDFEEKSLTANGVGWLETERLLIFPIPSYGVSAFGDDLIDSYDYTIKSKCGTKLQEHDFGGGPVMINVPAACSEEAQAEVSAQQEEQLEEGDPAPAADPEAPVDCGRVGAANDEGTCDCPDGFAGPKCQYSDRSTCSGYGIAQADGSCDCVESSNRTGDNCELFNCAALNCDDGNSCTEDTCTGAVGCSSAPAADVDECLEEDAKDLEEEANEREEQQPGNSTGSGSGSGSGVGSSNRPGDSANVDDTPAAGGCAAGGSSNPATSLLVLLAMAFLAPLRRRRDDA